MLHFQSDTNFNSLDCLNDHPANPMSSPPLISQLYGAMCNISRHSKADSDYGCAAAGDFLRITTFNNVENRDQSCFIPPLFLRTLKYKPRVPCREPAPYSKSKINLRDQEYGLLSLLPVHHSDSEVQISTIFGLRGDLCWGWKNSRHHMTPQMPPLPLRPSLLIRDSTLSLVI